MKQKVVMILSVVLIMGINVYAVPFLDNSQEIFNYSIDGNSYTIVDRILMDELPGDFDPVYGGYWAADDSWAGVYLGTVDMINGHAANENLDILTDLISHYLGEPYVIATYDKFDVGEGLDEDGLGVLEVNLADMTWNTSIDVEFYTVKGATDFALYYLPDLATSGKWTTEHLLNGGGGNPALSHLSVVYDTAPVPEPGSLILLGMGLLGLAGIGKRKLNKK